MQSIFFAPEGDFQVWYQLQNSGHSERSLAECIKIEGLQKTSSFKESIMLPKEEKNTNFMSKI